MLQSKLSFVHTFIWIPGIEIHTLIFMGHLDFDLKPLVFLVFS
jgi:hypothetical protein